MVIEYLLMAPASQSARVARILEGIVDNLKDHWTIHGWRKDGRQLLARLLGSGNAEAAATARRTVNKLEAKGYGGFADLL
jgi:hypothetical protein